MIYEATMNQHRIFQMVAVYSEKYDHYEFKYLIKINNIFVIYCL